MNEPERKTGRVAKLRGDYGFIHSDEAPEADLYFQMKWCKDDVRLQENDLVSFEVKMYNGKPQAHQIARLEKPGSGNSALKPNPASGTAGGAKAPNPRPLNNRILDWAYLGYLPDVLGGLSRLALPERWEFQRAPSDGERPFPILYSYLLHTYGRLYREQKVVVNSAATCAAINTGLVDPRYEPIYALFVRNQDARLYWKLADFCIAAEGVEGQNLVRNFNPLPEPAHYFDDPSELLYDARAGKPETNWQHIVIDNVDRFPAEFIDENRPRSFTIQDTSSMTDKECGAYFDSLREAIAGDNRVYRLFIARLKDALDLSIKKVSWNFKTAIPQYYTRVERLQLLLPLCLVSDDRVDLALAVERTESGNYLGHTIFPLDLAYKHARLICRPDSDWLVPDEITEGIAED